MIMIERDLQAASDLLGLIKFAQNSIDIAKADAVNLRVFYETDPFIQDGKTYSKVSTAGALGIDPEELRIVVHDAIVQHLESKIAHYRVSLAKLGVKLDEPDADPLKDAKEAGKRSKKLKAQKQLRLVAPTGDQAAT